MTQLLLGIDIGTQGSKGVLVDPEGNPLAWCRREHPVIHPRPGWAEHDPQVHWWGDFVGICRELVTKPGVRPEDIAGVCVSGLIPDLAPTDEKGQPLRTAILYSDNRAVQEIDFLNQKYGLELTSEEIAPKLLWFMRNQPELFAQTRMIFNAHSYIVYHLTGAYTIDTITACLVGALYESSTARWRPGVCTELGIPLDILPQPYPPAQVVGEVTVEAAADTGLAAGTPVLAGSGDVYFSLLSAGIEGPGDVMIYYGTAGLTSVPHVSIESLAWKPYPVDDGFPFSYPAYILTSGEIVRWFRDEFSGPEVEVAARLNQWSAYQLLDAQAEQVPPGCDGLVLLPHFLGQRSPCFDPRARGVFFGLSMAHRSAHLFRAVLEAYGYGIRNGLEAFTARHPDARIDRVVATGGGATSAVWKQIVSDILGRDQLYVAQAEECLGGAYLAGVGTRVFSDFGALRRDWIEVTGVTEFDESTHQKYEPYFEMYRSLQDALRDQFSLLDEITSRG
ncbi:MAG: FGGY family carbohydrate kinase [Anaerolineae bacterium]|jgi:xylulokinase